MQQEELGILLLWVEKEQGNRRTIALDHMPLERHVFDFFEYQK